MKTTEPALDVPLPAHVVTTPQLLRGSMTPLPWAGLGGSIRTALGAALGDDRSPALPATPARWMAAATERRRLLLALVVGSAALATLVLESTTPAGNPWTTAQTALFALLFAWVSAGCVTAVMGYFSLLRGDRHALSAAGVADHAIDPSARTAIVMPICNEDIATVAAGLRATCESLIKARLQAGAPSVFDVYLLSDTADPKLREAELAAWQELRTTLGDLPVYYRCRTRRTKKKAGNVADFCRRWGRQYRYMVVLDADSVMSGEALLTMVRLMEAHPRAGIVQSAPQSCGHDSLHARVQQFSGRVSGALFSAGLRYWQLGESHYWGHNAILRVEPFMKHCALAPLPGRGGLSGPIMSHDFVEAALMRRAGYEVWLVPDIEGSFEQPPPHLIDELTRDRRWCQGNLQNARLMAEPGLAGVHRAMFVTGAMSYVASPLWLAFALLGVLPWLVGGGASGEGSGVPMAAVVLWVATLAMLFVPRVLAVCLVVQRGEAAAYGGGGKLAASAALEALLSALQAPVRMVAHSIFVLGALTGLKLAWKSPSREATAVGWREAAGQFGLVGVLVTATLAWWMAGEPAEAWRVLPMALPLMLAVPLAVMTSRTGLGRAWRRRGWLMIPEESRPPAVLQAAWRHARPATLELPARPAVPALPVAQPALFAAAAARPAGRPAPARARSAGTLAWSGRSLAFASVALASVVAMMVPGTVATGGLSSSDVAAMRIVMMASSPEAAPRVLETERPARSLRRVLATSAGERVIENARATRSVGRVVETAADGSDSPMVRRLKTRTSATSI